MSIWTREVEAPRFSILEWFWKRWPVFLVLAVIVYLIYGFFQCGIMTARWIKRRRAAKANPDQRDPEKDAVSALVALGYKKNESVDAVKRAMKGLKPGTPVEELLKRSLKYV